MTDSKSQISDAIRWRWGVLAGVALMLLSLYPQLRLWQTRGREWQGNYAYNDLDEVAYAAYLNALIAGRPRRNDPYTGHDEQPDRPQPESIFSVQFLTPQVLAWLARLFGWDAAQAMMALAALAGLTTGLALFWLIAALTGDEKLALAGALLVICCGTLACWQGAVGHLRGMGPAYPFLPAFRRYIPAGAFAVFWAFAACVWRALTAPHTHTRRVWVCGAGACFAWLVFSYFYLWTTALVWLVCLTALWLWARRADGRTFFIIITLAALSLAPYAYLLTQRAVATDAVQLLARTHAPDITRLPGLLGLAALLILLLGILREKVNPNAPLTLFTAAFALTPLITFNQQILTGHSLQPVHYEVFIGNYCAVLALVLSIGAVRVPSLDGFRRELKPPKPSQDGTPNAWLRPLLSIAWPALAWGVYEAHTTSAVLDEANLLRDRMRPVMRQLDAPGLVFSSDFLLADEIPGHTANPVLWARHLHVFAGAGWQESHERFFQNLYWLNLDEDWLEGQLRGRNFVVVYALFGWGRLSDRLIDNPQPLAEDEIADAVARYAAYRENFSRADAARVPLSYVIVPAHEAFPWTRLDQWYTRDAGATAGEYVIYRVHLR